MNGIIFEWDDAKNASNITKHNISFDEARGAFYDPYALIIADPDHSEIEERLIILGKSYLDKLLVVCHCYRLNDNVIRIFSARRATKQEAKNYGGDAG